MHVEECSSFSFIYREQETDRQTDRERERKERSRIIRAKARPHIRGKGFCSVHTMPRVPFMGLHEKFCTHILRCFVSFYQAQPCYRRSAVSKPIARAHSSVRTPPRFCICVNPTIPDTETFTHSPTPPLPRGGEYARGYANVQTVFHFE